MKKSGFGVMFDNLSTYRKLLRIEQWYKNLVIFLPIFFVETGAMQTPLKLFWGFLAFCCISSASYILNDWRDREEDALHPTKKNRPLASGKIKGKEAALIAAILLLIVGLIVFQMGLFYAGVLAVYALLTTAYSFGAKNIPVIDITIIAVNFLLRMSAGFLTLPAFDEVIYFVALFAFIIMMLSHKRRSDNKLLKGKASRHKPVLRFYTMTNTYIVRLSSYLLLGWAFYEMYKLGNLDIESSALFFVLLVFTSHIFSKDPNLAINPHYLLRLWYWDVVALACVAILLTTA